MASRPGGFNGTSPEQKSQTLCALQRQEADFMIGGVCARLMEVAGDVPIITLHDGLYFPEWLRPKVMAAMRDQMTVDNLRLATSPPLEY
jgi:hypothetical protein